MRINRNGLESGENGDREVSEQYVAVIQFIWSRTRAMAVKTEKQHR